MSEAHLMGDATERVPPSSFEDRLDQLAAQLRVLTARVDELASQVQVLTAGGLLPEPPCGDEKDHAASRAESGPRLAAPVVLSDVAAVCFLLVVALTLRTATDNGLINQRAGLFLGLGYALLVVLYGFRKYAKKGPHAPVYVISGTLLIYAIVLETHIRFALLSTHAAYAILGLTLLLVTVLGTRYGTPLCVSVIGTTVVALPLDFPDPPFPYLAALLLLANGSAYIGSRAPARRWLLWVQLALTILFWTMWTLKARMPLLRHQSPEETLGLHWFLVGLGVFVAAYAAIAVWSAARRTGPLGLLDLCLPIIYSAWGYFTARAIVLPWYGTEWPLATAGVAAAIGHIALALWLAGGSEKKIRAAPSFLAAGAVLLAAALPPLTESILFSVLAWSYLALLLALIPRVRKIPRMRTLLLALQTFAFIMAFLPGRLSLWAALPFSHTFVALALSLGGFLHYRLHRTKMPQLDGGRIGWLDPVGPLGVLLLLESIGYVFAACCMVLFASLTETQVYSTDLYQSSLSVLINGGALVLALLALRRPNAELFAVACAMAGLGALKVFGYDFLHIRGVPLVASVFSFGLTAAFGSLLWGRWQRQNGG